MAPKDVVNKMLKHDLFSQWLGIQIETVKEGYCKTSMKIRPEMINGLGIVHGGIAFSLADSTFAFACNNRNQLSVALDTSINYLEPVHVGDTLTAESEEIRNGSATGLYQIRIWNQQNKIVAVFKGVCFRTKRLVVKEEGPE